MSDPKETEVVTDIEKFETRHPSDTAHQMPAVVAQSSMDVVLVALQKGYDPAFIEKMMDLQERNEKNEARKAYHKAVAEFKAIAPRVKKDKFNKWFDSWHTSLGHLLDTYNPVLGKCGLSISFPTKPPEKDTLSVECKLSHELGHSESIIMVAPIDKAAIGKTSGQKSRNPIQDIRSTFTYLRSMTAEAVLGVAGTEGSLDDDGNGAGKGKTEPKKELVPEAKNHWANAVTAYRRDKNFKSIENHVYISPDNKRKIIADAKDVKVGEPA